MRNAIMLAAAASVIAATVMPSTGAFARVWRVPKSGVAPLSTGNVGVTNGLARRCIFVPDVHGVQHQVCL